MGADVGSAALIGWGISLAILVLGCLSLVVLTRGNRGKLPVRPWYVFCAAVFVTAFTFVLSQELAGLTQGDAPLLSALFTTIQMFLLERDIDLDGSAVQSLVGGLASSYVAYNALLYLIAPLTTVGTALMLLAQFVSLPLLWVRSRHRVVFAFSALTPDALALATSTSGQDARVLVVFCDISSCDDEDLAMQAREAHLMLLNQSIEEVVRWCGSSSKPHIVFSSDIEASNLSMAIRLSESLETQRLKCNIGTVHVFSQMDIASPYIDVISRKMCGSTGAGTPVRRISAVENLVQDALQAYPLFLPGRDGLCAVAQQGEGATHTLVVVGKDELCLEFVKGAVWCGRGYNLSVRIVVVDADADVLRQRLTFACPEIMGKEDTYHLEFYSVPAQSGAYLQLLRDNATTISHVVVSQDDDLETAAVAGRTREIMEQCKYEMLPPRAISPVILARIGDAELAEVLAHIQVPKGQSYDISPLGNRNTALSFAHVFDSNLVRLARNLNRAYWGYYDTHDQTARRELRLSADQSFNLSEYSRRSSMASALFLKYDLFSFCAHSLECGDGCVSQHELEALDWSLPLGHPSYERVMDRYSAYVASQDHMWLLELEHDRWNAYIRTLGYEVAKESAYRGFYPHTGKDQDQLGCLHICLVPFDELDDVDRMAERVEGVGRALPFKAVDDVVVRHLADIVRDRD